MIAAQLLQLTYLHRTQPTAPVELVLNSTQVAVLKTNSPKLPKVLTVAWALEAVACLGGYLEHRCNSNRHPSSLAVVEIARLCQGWQLASQA